MKVSKLLAILISAGFVASAAQAQESGTLKKIKDSGTITLGVRDSSIPFSYLDDGVCQGSCRLNRYAALLWPVVCSRSGLR